MSRCRSCGSPLLKRSQKILCSNTCQAEDRRGTGTQRWLESGEAWIDGRRGHYVRQYLATAQSGRCDSQLPTYKSRNRGSGRHYRRQRYAEGQSF